MGWGELGTLEVILFQVLWVKGSRLKERSWHCSRWSVSQVKDILREIRFDGRAHIHTRFRTHCMRWWRLDLKLLEQQVAIRDMWTQVALRLGWEHVLWHSLLLLTMGGRRAVRLDILGLCYWEKERRSMTGLRVSFLEFFMIKSAHWAPFTYLFLIFKTLLKKRYII